jgi:hypothetical protein
MCHKVESLIFFLFARNCKSSVKVINNRSRDGKVVNCFVGKY